MDIAHKVLEKIKSEKLSPKPRWQFLLKDEFLKVSFIILLIIGGISFSVMFYILFDRDWQFLSRGRLDLVDELLFALPYFWIIVLILFVGVAFYNFRHTQTGYKHKGYLIILISFFGSVLLGFFLFTFGAGQIFDKMLADNFPHFDYRAKYINHMWGRPQEGMLAGKILEIKDGKLLILNDLGNEIWQVDYNKARIAPHFELKPEELVRIWGDEQENHFIKAKEIFPLEPPCPFRSCPLGSKSGFEEMKERIIFMRIKN